MKSVSITVVLACPLFASFSSYTANCYTTMTLALGKPEADVRLSENTTQKNQMLCIGAPVTALVKKLRDIEVFLSATRKAFAVKRILTLIRGPQLTL